MNSLMLDGLTPILLFGLIAAIIIFLLSRILTRKAFYFCSTGLIILCVGMIMYSIKVVRGWEGAGIGVISFSVIVGILVGTLFGTIFSKRIKNR